ncbi:MAG TPA: 6,7-dimethyl-8-ribityllumazine synthase [bacterium]|nr:6,7-dimethyl-8-ribityllumazine synthase [bacterium]
MAKVFEGVLDGKGRKFGIVASRFNEAISVRLLDGALDCLKRHGTDENGIEIAWVPGSFEIPLAARRMAESGAYDGVICLGALIRGATPHFDIIASEVAKGVARAADKTGLPVVFGVITADSMEQAVERSGGKSGNKGWNAALSALEMVSLMAQLKSKRTR